MKLFNKNFVLLLLSHSFGMLGDYTLMFALPLYILQATGSPAIFGGVMALAFVPSIIMSPIGGIFADRISKKKMIVAMQVSVSALIFLFIWASGFVSIVPAVMVVLMGIYGILGIGYPAIDSSVPQVVPEAQIVRASGIVGFMGQVSEFIAPMVAGLLFVNVGLMPVVVISGICYVLAAAMGVLLKIPHVKQERIGNIPQMIQDDIRVTARFLSEEKPQMIKIVLVLAMLGLVLIPIVPIGLPILIIGHLGMSGEMLGFAMGGAIGVGGIVGGILASVVGDKLKMKDCPKLLLFECFVMIPIGLVFLFNMNQMAAFVIIVASAGLIMITATLLMIRVMGYIQVETPEEILGKVISVLGALMICTHPLGFFLGGVLFQRLENTAWAVIFLAAVVSLGITLWSAQHFRRISS